MPVFNDSLTRKEFVDTLKFFAPLGFGIGLTLFCILCAVTHP